MISRRRFLTGSALVSLTGCVGAPLESSLSASIVEYPFTLGIASGDPTHDSMILWTRLAPDPLRADVLSLPINVTWVVATDRLLRDIVHAGSFVAKAESAHCVHVEASGLQPNTTYYYQFAVTGHISPLGRTRTLPEPGTPLDDFSIALTSCQEYSLGYFTVYQDVVAKNPNLVVHNGDYIYEAPSGTLRPYPINQDAVSLSDYRKLYALYRQDSSLQLAHASLPWHVIWDDHEVVNDWGPDHYIPTSHNRPVSASQHQARKQAARKAFLEHMPLRAALRSDTSVFFSRSVIGDLLELNHLDVRSYRSTPVCNTETPGRFEDCPDLEDSNRSMLGGVQEQWLFNNYGTSGCRWNCLSQTTMLAQLDREAGPKVCLETDSWDNYPITRQRIVEHCLSKRIRNPVSLGGNIHAFYAGVVPKVAGTTDCDSVMTEIVTSSITALGGDDGRYNDIHGRLSENPCIQYFENRHRGYTHLKFSHQDIIAEFRAVDSIETETPTFTSLESLRVRDGAVGVEQAV